MSKIQDELVKATKFNGDQYVGNRQDWLGALLRAIDKKLDADAYDLLTDEAAKWHTAAVAAFDKKRPVPDFPDADEDTDNEGGQGLVPLPPEGGGRELEVGGEGEANRPEKSNVKGSKKGKQGRPPLDYSKLTGEKDRYGITEGTQTSQAIKMYEKGTTSRELMDKLGGRHYNILKKLKDEGHKVEKLAGGIWKLVHKDDIK